MPIVIPSNHFQAVLNWTSNDFDSGGAATVLGFRVDGGIPDLALAAAAIGTAVVDHVMPAASSFLELTSVYAATATSSIEVPFNVDGVQNLLLPPPNVTMLVRKTTAAKGRRGRGRSYWPLLLGEGDITDNGLIAGSSRTAWQGIMDDVVEQWETAGYEQVVLQSISPEQTTPPLSPPPVVTGYIVDAKVATQRRRLRR